MPERRKNIGGNSVYAAAAATLLAFLVALALVADLASREADRHALRAETNMVRLEVERMRADAAAALADWAYWDDAVDALTRPGELDPAFIAGEFVEADITNYGYGWLAVVAPDGKTRFAVTGDRLLRQPENFALTRDNADLVAKARERYRAARVRTARGFMVPTPNGETVPKIEASAVRLVDGRPSLVVAQVIVPDTEDFALQDGQDHVMIAEQPFTADAMAAFDRRLGLSGLRIVPVAEGEMPSVLPLADDARDPALVVTWAPAAPRPAILAAVAPVAGGVAVLLCAVLGFIVVRHVRALTSLAAREQELSQMALRDALTGLSNRASFDRELSACIERARSTQFAVMCIDLDRFKAVNDKHGHAAGDAVLKTIAHRFAARMEGRGIVARIGGDEFIALVTSGTSSDELMWLGDLLVDDASRPVPFEGQVLEVGASVGVALWPDDGETARDLIAAADGVLYESKRGGRGRAMLSRRHDDADTAMRQTA